MFLTVQTTNDPQPVIVRVKEITPAGFQAALFEEEASTDGHGVEVVGYLAIYDPDGQGFINVSGTYAPFQVAALQVDSNFTKVVNQALRLQEEQSKDAETDHPAETVALLSLSGQLFAQDMTSIDSDPAALRWDSVDRDGDGYVDRLDAYPDDPQRWEAPTAVGGGDTAAPTVLVTSLKDGQTLGRLENIDAQAHDNTAVNRLELYIDGEFIESQSGDVLQYRWRTRWLTPGAHQVTVWAFDEQENKGEATVTVTK